MKNKKSAQPDLKSHVGEWVAICNKKVVACGADPGNVMDMARQICGSKETTIFRVPEKDQILLL